MDEAPLADHGSGLAPTAEGWFVVNTRDTEWWKSQTFGAGCVYENRELAPFGHFGINLAVLEPGEPNCLYHGETQQEAFLVLHGECRLLVEGQERLLKAWDFFHCPPEVEHVFVGAGDGPCVVLMAGARTPDEQLIYPASELAARYGASAAQDTPDADEAYAPYERPERGHPPSWERLPWNGS